jgi:hypothetical protein
MTDKLINKYRISDIGQAMSGGRNMECEIMCEGKKCATMTFGKGELRIKWNKECEGLCKTLGCC